MYRFALSFLFIGVLFLSACLQNTGSQGEDFSSNVNKVAGEIGDDAALLTFFEKPRKPIAPAFVPLPTGANRPKGWLLEIMKQDLERGIVGALG